MRKPILTTGKRITISDITGNLILREIIDVRTTKDIDIK